LKENHLIFTLLGNLRSPRQTLASEDTAQGVLGLAAYQLGFLALRGLAEDSSSSELAEDLFGSREVTESHKSTHCSAHHLGSLVETLQLTR
jgi:hypothetical protein